MATPGLVVRVGDTVRRRRGHWTPAVHALLDHLESVGFDAAPRALGTDTAGPRRRGIRAGAGRDPGTGAARTARSAPPRRAARIGAWLAGVPRRAGGFRARSRAPVAAWCPGRALRPGEVVRAPGRRHLQHRAAGRRDVRRDRLRLRRARRSRVDDLAYALWSWTPLWGEPSRGRAARWAGSTVADRLHKFAAVVEGYAADAALRAERPRRCPRAGWPSRVPHPGSPCSARGSGASCGWWPRAMRSGRVVTRGGSRRIASCFAAAIDLSRLGASDGLACRAWNRGWCGSEQPRGRGGRWSSSRSPRCSARGPSSATTTGGRSAPGGCSRRRRPPPGRSSPPASRCRPLTPPGSGCSAPLTPENVGLNRAEIEGRIPQIVADPSRLGTLAAATPSCVPRRRRGPRCGSCAARSSSSTASRPARSAPRSSPSGARREPACSGWLFDARCRWRRRGDVCGCSSSRSSSSTSCACTRPAGTTAGPTPSGTSRS